MVDFKGRGKWANKTEFILSCLGYAIGFGNVWRFPYLCYRNGGGAFLIPYLLMLFLCGIPLFFMETSLGQFSGTSCISVFKIAPIFKGAGYAIVIINFMCTSYYFVILAYPLVFIANCFRKVLPWVDCSNPWNTANCVKITSGYHSQDDLTNSTLERPYANSKWSTPAEEFFHNQVLQISNGIENLGTIVWPLFTCTIISWLAVYLCIARGVKSIGKVVYFTATFPFVILFALLIRGLTLPGAWEGVKFYIYPQWNELLNLKVWADAAAQIFYSLGPGWGGMLNMASFNDFRNNNKGDSVLVPIMNCGTSIFAGFVVFSVLGFMAHETGLSVASVATGGPGLAFVTYPEAITMMPWPHLWALLFFFMFFLLGIDSTFVQLEVIISSLLDEFPNTRKYKGGMTFGTSFILLLFSFLFVTNGGIYILQLLDWYCASIPVILICLVELISVSWAYGAKRFVSDVEFMLQQKLHIWWTICWKYVSPSILIFILITTIVFNTKVTYNGQKYPEWSIVLGWLSCLVSVIWIPIIALLKLSNAKGSFKQRLRSILKEAEGWGPSADVHRQEWTKLLADRNVKKGNSEVSTV